MKNRRASRLVSLVRMASVLATAAFSLGVRAGTLDLAVRDRAPEYTIVHAADASPSVKYAARELRDFTERMTGVRLPIADSAPSSGKAVFLDPPRLASGVSRPSDLGEDGFLLKAEAGNVYVFGGRRGVLYGVYELLEKFGGCRWYASWHTVVPQREAFSVPGDLNDAQKPAFPHREPLWTIQFPMTEVTFESGRRYVLRMRLRADLVPGRDGQAVTIGIYDPKTKKYGCSGAYRTGQLSADYAWYDVGEFDPSDLTPGAYVYVGDGYRDMDGNRCVDALYLDCLQFAEAK